MNTAIDGATKLTRIGVFYDGNYFSHVSNYYLYQHERKARINIAGLHRFVIEEAAKAEDAVSRHCRIVDAHYFRGRLSAAEAQSRDSLYKERVFDEVLMREGIVTHYLPLSGGGEKGIDVWLALEAFELAINKSFDVSVLIAGDGDYLPLIRKLNTIGTRVMVLSWDFSYTDREGNTRTTRTAQRLLDEATYPIIMSTLIDDRSRKSDPLLDNLFLKPKARSSLVVSPTQSSGSTPNKGKIITVKEGFGFISPDEGGDNIFFHYSDLENVDYNDLGEGDAVTYSIGRNDRGPCAKNVFKVGE